MDPKLKLDDWVGRTVDIVIDRPMGSTHPRHSDIVYPLNYGYIPGTMAPDGHPIDAYVLGADYPLRRCSASVIAIVRRRDDVEDKLIVALSGEWSKASIVESTAFQEQWFDTWIELPEGDTGRPLALGTAYRADPDIAALRDDRDCLQRLQSQFSNSFHYNPRFHDVRADTLGEQFSCVDLVNRDIGGKVGGLIAKQFPPCAGARHRQSSPGRACPPR